MPRRLTMLVVAFLVSTTAWSTPTFVADIEPIFARRCAGCHYPSADRLKGKLDLSTHAATLAGGASGASIVAGNSTASALIAMIEWREEPHMPPSDKFEKLPQAEIDLVRAWIDAGAPAGDAPETQAETTLNTTDSATAQSHTAAASTAVAFSPDGKWLARGALHKVDLYHASVEAPKHAATLDHHAEMVRALAFSPDGKTLAAAGGRPGREGEIKLWNLETLQEIRTVVGHSDNVLDIAFSPDGKNFVTCSYDKLMKVWDAESGRELHSLKDHVDAVYSVAYSPDGTRIASCAGDRSVKLWDAVTGERLVTFSDSTDSVYSVAFSPDGAFLAGGCGDKMIRIWDINESMTNFTQMATSTGVLAKSGFAHDGAVLDVAYTADGSTLFSTGEDSRIKAWDVSNMSERFALEPQPDWVLALALSPDGSLLATARYDASLEVYAAADGTEKWAAAGDGEIMLAAAAAPTPKQRGLNVDAVFINATIPASIQSVNPVRVHRGAEFEMEVAGKNLTEAKPYFLGDKVHVEVISNEALPVPEFKYDPAATGAQIYDQAVPHKLRLKVRVAEDAPAGQYFLFCETPLGITEPPGVLNVLPRPDVAEIEPNNDAASAQRLDAFPTTVIGGMNAGGDVDLYRIQAQQGQEIVFALTDLGINPSVSLKTAAGEVLPSTLVNRDGVPRLSHKFTEGGEFILEVRDVDMRANLYYRLHIGAFPAIEKIEAIGITSGPPVTVSASGVNLGREQLELDPPDEAKPWQFIPVALPAVEGNPIPAPKLHVSPYAVQQETEPNNEPSAAISLGFPAAVDAVLDDEGDLYRFTAEKDQQLVVDVVAARAGSPVDSVVEILDASGTPLQRAQARCVGQTMMTLSDRDSRSGGLRIEDWSFLQRRDFVMVGSEVLQVEGLPDYADEDMTLVTFTGGQRMGMLATTPEHHAVGTPVYKVELHPVGVQLPPNGMPVFPIYWRNDDYFYEGTRQGDSRLEFTAPEAGEYLLRVRDAIGKGADHRYRLMLRPNTPDFELSAGPYRLNINAGSSTPLDVRIKRYDGFAAPVNIHAEGLPEGLHMEPAVILRDEEEIRVQLKADEDAAPMEHMATFKIVATADTLAGIIRREATLGEMHVVKRAADLIVHQDKAELVVIPGQKIGLTVRLERNNGFTSRVPIDVLNLPYGVRILDTGLNGILVRESEFERSMEIYCEPWVEPLERDVFVQARIESPSPGRLVFLGSPVKLRVEKPAVIAKQQ